MSFLDFLKFCLGFSLRKKHTFGDTTTGFLTKCCWETSTEIPYRWHITTQIWVVLLIGHATWLIQPMRSTTQIWVVMRHQYGISLLISQTSFGGETSGKLMLQIFGCFLRLFWVGFSWPHHSKKVDWWWILLCLLNSGNTFYELLAFQIKQILLSLSELLRLIAIKVINIFFH